jgi:hypothetical protein
VDAALLAGNRDVLAQDETQAPWPTSTALSQCATSDTDRSTQQDASSSSRASASQTRSERSHLARTRSKRLRSWRKNDNPPCF